MDQNFLRKAATYLHADEAVEILNEKFTKFSEPRPIAARYNSTSIASHADNLAKDRVIVYVPGDPEKWIQFTMRGPKDNPGARPGDSINVVAVYTPSGSKERRTVFQDYHRLNKNEHISVERATYSEGDCRSCHKGGPHYILPKTAYKFEKQIAEINDLMKPMARFASGYHADYLGPPIVDQSIAQTPGFFEKCTRGLPGVPLVASERQIWWSTVKKGMVCAHCHQVSEKEGILNFPLGLAHGGQLIEHFIKDGVMPDLMGDGDTETNLDLRQRQALVSCIRYAYYGLLPNGRKDPSFMSQMDRWLRAPACGNTSSGRSSMSVNADTHNPTLPTQKQEGPKGTVH